MDLTSFSGLRLLDNPEFQERIKLASVSPSASLPNACEVVHDYMEVHLSSSTTFFTVQANPSMNSRTNAFSLV